MQEMFIHKKERSKLNFSKQWGKISTLWHYLLLQPNKTLYNLTLTNQFSIPLPSPVGRNHSNPAGLGATYPTP